MAAWPLDRMIAVNPFWPHIHEPFAQVVTRCDPSRSSFIIDHVSESCAAYFDRGQATWSVEAPDLYTAWRERASHDRTPAITLKLERFNAEVRCLPTKAEDMIALAKLELGTTTFLRGLRGWASYCAYAGAIESVTAIGAAWDVIIWRLTGVRPEAEVADSPYDEASLVPRERAYQAQLRRQFAPSLPLTPPALQIVFCIDVRSEIMRRAVEAEFPSAQTLGFAGFFGLPIVHDGVPHLPGPLSPQLHSTSGRPLSPPLSFDRVKRSAGSGFSYVETLGGLDGLALLLMTMGRQRRDRRHPKPKLTTALDPQAKATLAAGILRGMSLTKHFAPLVILLGHGASTTNNPHAHAYDCGACGGQPGDVNARLVADLLNEPQVRAQLVPLGITIPQATRFAAGLHDTTTDDITLFDAVEYDFSRATHHAREARAALWNETRSPVARARDWSEPRPEWGLCNNAAFIVARRSRTRHIDLHSRVFLHDYDAAEDRDWAVLTQILTAPVVVAHWINMQYFASSVAPTIYGSGNKVLHDVCAGGVGVLEGNGGDLRVGLPLQAVNDGERFRHEPLRLSVFVDAPQVAIDGIVRDHPVLQNLVGNGWLHLFTMDENDSCPADSRKT